MKKIRLLLIEENRLLREGIMMFINRQADFRALAAIGTNDDILRQVATFKPHIALLDPEFRDQGGSRFVRTMKEHSATLKVIAMNASLPQPDLLELIFAGVAGFILKDATASEFTRTIRSIAQGETVLPFPLTTALFSQIVGEPVEEARKLPAKVSASAGMTRRERQVMELIAVGMTNKAIAQTLNLSVYTVKSHVHVILEKLLLHTRVEIAKYAHSTNGLRDVSDATIPTQDHQRG